METPSVSSSSPLPTTSRPSRRILGVDWSGAKKAGKKIWFARIDLGDRPTLVYLDRPFLKRPTPADVLGTFAQTIADHEPDVVGFDFCFGVAERQITQLCSLLGAVVPVKVDPYGLIKLLAPIAATADDFRAKLAPEKKRVTDAESASPFAPTNLRMYRQTWLGIHCLASLGPSAAIFPFHRSGRPLFVEVLPASIARTLGTNGGYKGRGAAATTARTHLTAIIATKLAVSSADRATMVADREGDAVDAVLAAIAAIRATDTGPLTAPSNPLAVIEGWIVP